MILKPALVEPVREHIHSPGQGYIPGKGECTSIRFGGQLGHLISEIDKANGRAQQEKSKI
jgi:hypothetical protein